MGIYFGLILQRKACGIKNDMIKVISESAFYHKHSVLASISIIIILNRSVAQCHDFIMTSISI